MKMIFIMKVIRIILWLSKIHKVLPLTSKIYVSIMANIFPNNIKKLGYIKHNFICFSFACETQSIHVMKELKLCFLNIVLRRILGSEQDEFVQE